MKQTLLFLLPLFLFAKELPFVILIPSYNNEKYCARNIHSALSQRYENFRILYVNDASTDKTLEIAQDLIEQKDIHNRIEILDNKERHYSLYNIYHTIHNEVRDEEIVVMLDGDDQLAHPGVLNTLNTLYQQESPEIWFAFSQFKNRSNGEKGWGCPVPRSIVAQNKFRSYRHVPTHLRTFYGWLFKKIRKEDLQVNGEFFHMTGDLAFLLPIIEMARDHFTFINQILYIYNDKNPISDHQIDQSLQRHYDKLIRKRPRYQPL
ncbi:MAG: hypothetical protein ChlgKO_05410 [Chlamydiales bacterium]